MAVNREQEYLLAGLSAGLDLLKDGGRMAVISFHSIEDRKVKTFFRQHVGRWESLQAGGRRWTGECPAVVPVTRKPVVPSVRETAANPRCRSAKLRVVEKKPDSTAFVSVCGENSAKTQAEET
jgi:16S rRNA (cytosine1402-N4)-methyltransferase